MPNLINVYPFGIPLALGELKLTCPKICVLTFLSRSSVECNIGSSTSLSRSKNALDKPNSLLSLSEHRTLEKTEKIVRKIGMFWKFNKQIPETINKLSA
jgi:hypothetical protein